MSLVWVDFLIVKLLIEGVAPVLFASLYPKRKLNEIIWDMCVKQLYIAIGEHWQLIACVHDHEKVKICIYPYTDKNAPFWAVTYCV